LTKIIGSAALTAPDPEGENLTTKGDLHGYSDENTRIPIGDDDQVLTADSSEDLGLKWATASGVSLSGTNTWTGVQTFTAATGGGKWEHLQTYTASGDSDTSKEFTGFSYNLATVYSRIIVVFRGQLTGAGNIRLFINETTSGGAYNFDILLQDATTVSGVNVANQDLCEVIPTELADAGRYVWCTTEIKYASDATAFIISWNGGAISEGLVSGSGTGNGGSGSILDAVGMDIDANAFQGGTMIDVYGERK